MSEMRTRIKEKGRTILTGNWIRAGIILLIIGLLEIVISALQSAYLNAFNLPNDLYPFTMPAVISLVVSLGFQAISFVFSTPLKIGQTEWYWKLDGKSRRGIDGVFAWFGSLHLFIKSLLININIWLRMLAWRILLLLVPSALVYGSYLAFTNNQKNETIVMFASSLMFLGMILLIAGTLFYLFLYTRYFLAPYLLVEDNSRRINDCVKDSIRFTHGHRSEIFTFWFSFLGWLIPCIFILPIFFVLPYFYSSSAVFAKYLLFQSRSDVSSDTIVFDRNDDEERPL